MRGHLTGALVGLVVMATGPLVASAQRLTASSPSRFTVTSDGHPMAVWARMPNAAPRGVVLLLHGRTWSSRPDFDLQVPGLQRSVLQSLADRGYAAYALDFRGYGETPRDATGWLTPRQSAADVTAVLAWLRARHPNLPRPALVGWSRGAAVAQLVAQATPDQLLALVLFGFAAPEATYGDPALPEKPPRLPNTSLSARSDFISPKVISPAVIRAFVAQAMKADPVLTDVRGDGEFSALSPARVTVPTLVMFGELDPGVVMADAERVLAELAAPDKQMVVLPGADHAAQIEDTHELWIDAVVEFINRAEGAARSKGRGQRAEGKGTGHRWRG